MGGIPEDALALFARRQSYLLDCLNLERLDDSLHLDFTSLGLRARHHRGPSGRYRGRARLTA
jgi:hypothetical protein